MLIQFRKYHFVNLVNQSEFHSGLFYNVRSVDPECAGVQDLDWLDGSVPVISRCVTSTIDQILWVWPLNDDIIITSWTNHSLQDLAEAGMAVVKPGALHHGDVELRSVSVWTSISHAHPARSIVTEYEVLISEVSAVDTVATCSITIGEVTTCEYIEVQKQLWWETCSMQ